MILIIGVADPPRYTTNKYKYIKHRKRLHILNLCLAILGNGHGDDPRRLLAFFGGVEDPLKDIQKS